MEYLLTTPRPPRTPLMRAPYCLNSGLAPTSPTQPGQAMLSTFQIFYLSNNQQDRHNFLASVLTVNNIVDKVIEGYLWIAVVLGGRILTEINVLNSNLFCSNIQIFNPWIVRSESVFRHLWNSVVYEILHIVHGSLDQSLC